MKHILSILVLFLFIFLFAMEANSYCRCACVDGNVQAICTSTLDLEPICSPWVCPVVTPSVAPVQVPRVPPLGTKRCYQKQVYDYKTHRYEWTTLCE